MNRVNDSNLETVLIENILCTPSQQRFIAYSDCTVSSDQPADEIDAAHQVAVRFVPVITQICSRAKGKSIKRFREELSPGACKGKPLGEENEGGRCMPRAEPQETCEFFSEARRTARERVAVLYIRRFSTAPDCIFTGDRILHDADTRG